jgi:hypothetical protein
MASTLNADIRAHILAHGQVLHDSVDLLKYAPERWRTTLLIELATENLANCFELIQGVDTNNIAKCAWAGRNLLELHYFTRYVIQSPEKAKRFKEDMVCDFQDLLKRWGKNPLYAQALTQHQLMADSAWSAMTEARKGDKFLSSHDIAGDLGEQVPYGDLHKYLSKFVHPTSLSIQFRKAEQVYGIVLGTVVEMAARLIAHTFPLLAKHIKEYSETVVPKNENPQP